MATWPPPRSSSESLRWPGSTSTSTADTNSTKTSPRSTLNGSANSCRRRRSQGSSRLRKAAHSGIFSAQHQRESVLRGLASTSQARARQRGGEWLRSRQRLPRQVPGPLPGLVRPVETSGPSYSEDPLAVAGRDPLSFGSIEVGRSVLCPNGGPTVRATELAQHGRIESRRNGADAAREKPGPKRGPI